VLAEQVALAVPQMPELRGQRLEVWEPFDRHDRSYRQLRTGT
jgi:hypothetical protein